MESRVNVMIILLVFFVLTIFAVPGLSYADWSVGVGIGDGYHHDDHGYYHWHDHPHYGYHVHYIHEGYHRIWVGHRKYFYYDGLYYTYAGSGDYVLVSPPTGAYVDVIPPDFQPVSINGRTYYTDNGVYYILTHHHGYKVVAAPVVYVQPSAPVYSQSSFPVNIPNGNGSVTTVTIRKSGNGYAGPQGEFYAQFPTVAQLKTMYAK